MTGFPMPEPGAEAPHAGKFGDRFAERGGAAGLEIGPAEYTDRLWRGERRSGDGRGGHLEIGELDQRGLELDVERDVFVDRA